MSAKPFVSVIVPVYNDPARLRLCLAALERQSYPSTLYEVIVIDNASDVPVAPLVGAHAHARPVLEPSAGAYAARNAGLRLARGDVMAFTDADCQPARDWLAQGVAALCDGYDVAGGWIQTEPRDAAAPTLVERYALLASRRQAEVLERGEAATGNLFAWRAVMDDVGPFDASLRSGGDYDWCRRARAMGKRFVPATGARVRHPARRTLRNLVYREQRFMGGQYARARRRGPWAVTKLGVATLRAPFRVAPSMLRDGSVAPTLRGRLGVLAVAFGVGAGRICELARLMLGLAGPKR